jgi:hypothetical protein
MNRDRYKPVTGKESFAILIPTSPDKAMGEATFQMELGRPVPVRAVTLQELKSASRTIKGVEGDYFLALLTLKAALEARDELVMAKAKERLEKVYRLREGHWDLTQSPQDEELRKQLAESLATLVGLPPDESLKHFEGVRPGPRAKADPYRLLSYEVSKRVGFANTEVVLWWMDGEFRPAIYCKDIESALYVHTFFIAPTCGLGFRICPYDGEQFFQDRPNQEYCLPAHREAHRVARFRNRKKLETAEAKITKEKKWHSKNAARRGTVISLSTGNDSGSRLRRRIGEKHKAKKRN